MQVRRDKAREERVVEVRFGEEIHLVLEERAHGHPGLDFVLPGPIDVSFQRDDVQVGLDDREDADDVAVGKVHRYLSFFQLLHARIEDDPGNVPGKALHLDALLPGGRGEAAGDADQFEQGLLVPKLVDGGAANLSGDRGEAGHHGDEDHVSLLQADVGARVAGQEQVVQVDLLDLLPSAQDLDAPQRPDVLHPARDGEHLDRRLEGADVVPAGGAYLAHHGDADPLHPAQGDVGGDRGDGGNLRLEKGSHLLERLARHVKGAELREEDLAVPVDHHPLRPFDAAPHLDDDLVAGAHDVAGAHGGVFDELGGAWGRGEQLVAEMGEGVALRVGQAFGEEAPDVGRFAPVVADLRGGGQLVLRGSGRPFRLGGGLFAGVLLVRLLLLLLLLFQFLAKLGGELGLQIRARFEEFLHLGGDRRVGLDRLPHRLGLLRGDAGGKGGERGIAEGGRGVGREGGGRKEHGRHEESGRRDQDREGGRGAEPQNRDVPEKSPEIIHFHLPGGNVAIGFNHLHFRGTPQRFAAPARIRSRVARGSASRIDSSRYAASYTERF